MKIYFSIASLFFGFSVVAQEPVNHTTTLATDSANSVQIEFNDARILPLIDKSIKIDSKALEFDGFRIQISSVSGVGSQAKAREIQAQFISKYPEIPSYLEWDLPNFKVRVGDFRTRSEAEGIVIKLKKDFPGAYVVSDKIKFPAL